MAQTTGFVRGGLAISKILVSYDKSTNNVKEDTLNPTSEVEKQQG
ncbi:hypothetical protein NIES267_01380 [Calothrix parasitica NIES-267]|uniref:Uncharacterized protein n=1 Tax=Calothrix parasitica NIES-267 TaxID=1973488 RepID=A0A1Z4LHH7_9CYAN|nr:hypothetical protein NIES267_01380 [Calothrix parasitica NIES-267]